MYSMFSGCSSLSSLDLSGWDTPKVTSMYAMFSGCSKLAKVTLGANASLSKATNSPTITNYKWLKGAEADQNVVAGDALLTANTSIDAGSTETYLKAALFDSNDGSGESTAYSVYNLDWKYSPTSVADAARAGYAFNGWYTAASGGTKLAEGDAISAATYYAQWTASTSDITVKNTVSGAKVDSDKEFEYTLTLGAGSGASVPAQVSYEKVTKAGAASSGTLAVAGGKATFSLKHGESITFEGLSQGLTYSVAQADAEDYETTISSNASGTVGASDIAIAVSNKHLVNAVLPQAGSAGLAGVVGLAAAAAAAGLRRRRRARRAA